MSAAAIIAIAIAVVVVLAAIALRHARPPVRRPRRRRAVQRDPPPRRSGPRGPARPTSSSSRRRPRREAERAGRDRPLRHRRRPSSRRPPSAPWSPPDPEAIGVSRRQFFNRATVTLTSAGLGAFAAAGFVAFLWPTATGGFGQPVNVGKLDDIKDGIRDGQRLLLRPGGPHVDHRVPGRRPAEGRGGLPRERSSPAWSRASSPSTRSARTSAAACRSASPASGSSARATARSTTRSARRRPARRRAAWTASRSPSPPTATSPSTPATIVTGPADRHQHDRPGGRGPALHHRRGRALM